MIVMEEDQNTGKLLAYHLLGLPTTPISHTRIASSTSNNLTSSFPCPMPHGQEQTTIPREELVFPSFTNRPLSLIPKQDTNPSFPSHIYSSPPTRILNPSYFLPSSSPHVPLSANYSYSPVECFSDNPKQGKSNGFPCVWMSTPSTKPLNMEDSGFMSPGMGECLFSMSEMEKQSALVSMSSAQQRRNWEEERSAWSPIPKVPFPPGPGSFIPHSNGFRQPQIVPQHRKGAKNTDTVIPSVQTKETRSEDSLPKIERRPLQPILGSSLVLNKKSNKRKSTYKALNPLLTSVHKKRDDLTTKGANKQAESYKIKARPSLLNKSIFPKQIGPTKGNLAALKIGQPNRRPQTPSIYLDTSSSEDDLLNASNVFDEDLEPMDLSKRVGLTNDAAPKETCVQQSNNMGREGLDRLYINLNQAEPHWSDGLVQKDPNISPNGRSRDQNSNIVLLRNKDGVSKEKNKTAQLPLKKRQFIGQKEKRLSTSEQMGDANSGKLLGPISRKFGIICKKCSSDYRATSLVRCPICSGGTAIQNCTVPSNSTFSPLASLPFQLSLSRRQDSIVVLSNAVIKTHTLLGPMVGEHLSLREITKHMDVSNLWVTNDPSNQDLVVLSTRNELKSNWMRFVRVGSDSLSYNLALIHQKNEVFFITMQKVTVGQELVLRPIDPLLVQYNLKHESKCSLCSLICASPLHLAKHRLFFHPFRKDNVSPVQPWSPEQQTQSAVNENLAALNFQSNTATNQGIKLEHTYSSMSGTWLCAICNAFFKSKAGYKSHMSIVHKHHSSKPLLMSTYRCPECPATFRSQWNLYRHTRCHSLGERGSGFKSYSCQECGREFWRKQSYRRHVQAHQMSDLQMAPTCTHCGRKFYSSSNLKVHMLTHSGIKPFTCIEAECNMGFTTKQSLQFHYIKRHGYFYETMPRIERNVPFTFKDYGGSSVKEELVEKKQEDEAGDIARENPKSKESENQEIEEAESEKELEKSYPTAMDVVTGGGTQEGEADLNDLIDENTAPRDLD